MKIQKYLPIIGADISHLKQIEDFGGKFYYNHEERDCIEILREHGFNFIRLKVWNNPGLPLSDPAGYNSKKYIVEMAQRVKSAGFRLLIDFHYSDFWADPQKQLKPGDWERLTFPELNKAVFAFTRDVCASLARKGVAPDLVQIGNEVDNGMLWPDGKLDGSDSQWNNFTELLNSGIRGVKAGIPGNPRPRIMIHKADGCNSSQAHYFFDNIIARNVELDCVGFSYYPYFHGTFEALQQSLNSMAVTYKKDIIIVETAWGWTTESGDAKPNLIKTGHPLNLPFSIDGQIDFLKRLYNIIKSIPGARGKGFFYWEPCFIPVKGAGWKYGEGDEWANMTLFDFQGNALDSLALFKKLTGVQVT
jgi:arabinogalactan endo-1,4-beta-galactosidase